MHGGTSPGPGKGSTNALSHGGAYTNFSDEEVKKVMSRPIEDVTEEIYAVKIQIARMIEYDAAVKEYGLSLLQEETTTEGITEDGMKETKKTIKRVKDVSNLLERRLGRLANLITLHRSIVGTDKDDGMEVMADRIAESLRSLR